MNGAPPFRESSAAALNTGPATGEHPTRSDRFAIDLARAPQAVHELQAAIVELRSIREDAAALAQIDPGSRDSVSREAALRLGAVADSGPGSLVDALQHGIDHMQALVDSLQQEIRDYIHTDENSRDRFNSGR